MIAENAALAYSSITDRFGYIIPEQFLLAQHFMQVVVTVGYILQWLWRTILLYKEVLHA